MTREGHRRPGGPRRWVGPYHRVEHDPADVHPAELAVLARAPLEELNRRIHEAGSLLLKALSRARRSRAMTNTPDLHKHQLIRWIQAEVARSVCKALPGFVWVT